MTFDECDIRNALTLKIKEGWLNEKTCLPELLPEFSKEQKRVNEKRISENLNRFRKQIDAFSPTPGRKSRWKCGMERLIHEVLWAEPLFDIGEALTKESLGTWEEEIKTFVRRARRFDSTLTVEALGQALRNYIVYAIFCEINGQPQTCASDIFGYSMLYPYTDNYIDAPCRSREELLHYTKLVRDKIMGKSCNPVTEHDKKTVELLSLLEKSHSRSDDLYKGLLLLLEAQRDSQKQSDREQPLTADGVLTVTLLKGGISVLLDRYFIGLPLTEKDYEFYYGFGFLLQLCDDLQDIACDRKSGCRTVFSMSSSKEETIQNVNRLIHFMKRLLDSCVCVREELREFLIRNCLLLILISAAGSREYMTEEWLAWLEGRLPVSVDYLQELKRSFTQGDLKKNKKDMMRMVDAFTADSAF